MHTRFKHSISVFVMYAEAAREFSEMTPDWQQLLWNIAKYQHDQLMWSRGELSQSSVSVRGEGVENTDLDTGFSNDLDEPVDKGVDDTYGEHVKTELVDKLDDQPVKEPEVTSEPTNKIPPLVPQPNIPEYAWVDWNDPVALKQEEVLAKKHGIKNKDRGPAPGHVGHDELWRDMPFNPKAGHWGYWDRKQLPANYKFDDWWSEESLREEARLAKEHMIPWSLRGPPNGPGLDPDRQRWRGLQWRANSKQWMNRGGDNLETRNHVHHKGKHKGKGKGKGNGKVKGKGKNKGADKR